MKLLDLREHLERRKAEAQQLGTLVPEAKLLAYVLEQLDQVDGTEIADRWMTCEEAAETLRLAPKTVAKRCAAGAFAGATKTSTHGVWRIPARAVQTYRVGAQPSRPRAPIKLWSGA
jgi:hypothetical protein